ncbi:lysis protein [Serratia symbiotica]|uniref:lysis system i-spanin subunit Rz n=1 Tax=Serratia symbiotica TaxID=138074 RepID=UPI001D1DB583|nr:lysis system i-spanin subunit Rz [Serratia symbiotica]NIG88687.1 lysis protein [Serratia symbiotica]USS95782.1 lysis protein [Serratia symbiotica]
MTWLISRWQVALVVLVLSLLAYFAYVNQTLRHERNDLQSANNHLNRQIDWQNRTQIAVAAIDENRSRELTYAKSQLDDLQRDAAAGARKLCLAATCHSATAASVADADGPGLTDAAERDYFRLREWIEVARQQIAGL